MTKLLDYILSDTLKVGDTISQSLIEKVPKYRAVFDVPGDCDNYILISHNTGHYLWYQEFGRFTKLMVIDDVTHIVLDDCVGIN